MNGLLDFVTPDQRKAMQQDALTQSLLTLGPALLQASTGAPGQGKPRLGQILGQALPVGVQAYQGGIDRALQQMMLSQQMAEQQRRREQQARSEAARQQFAQQFAPTTPQTALAAPGRVGPTAARAGMIGQTPALDRNRLLAAMLDPNMPPDVAERAKAVFEATKPVETKAAPGDIGAYEAALARGFIPPGTTFQQFMTMRRPPGTTVNVGGEVSPFDKKVQEGKATMFLEIEKSGIAAQRSAQDVNRLEKLLSNIFSSKSSWA